MIKVGDWAEGRVTKGWKTVKVFGWVDSCDYSTCNIRGLDLELNQANKSTVIVHEITRDEHTRAAQIDLVLFLAKNEAVKESCEEWFRELCKGEMA